MNTHRSHLYAFGHVAPKGIEFVARLAMIVVDADTDIPDLAWDICYKLVEQIAHLTGGPRR
ncbi:hypothetical protein [Halovulum marinum]|uniref:hypothetical protein n=1 Tax=Halovulum marinum TaxID=2662447 RepID=UPI001F419751|nr:hypothetical protein [Halovulum marinum]